MQPLTITNLPTELITKIINFTDVQGVVGLLHITKQMKITHDTAFTYLQELKVFYDALICLQQQYSSKQELVCSGRGYDKNIMTTRVITGKVVKIDPLSSAHKLVLEPALTSREKRNLNDDLIFMSHPLNSNRYKEDIVKLKDKLAEDEKPKDAVLKPSLDDEYTVEMKDTSEEYKKSNKLVDVTIFPIISFSVTFDSESSLSEETKRQIIQCVDLANKYYKALSDPAKRSTLEMTLDVNTLKWGPFVRVFSEKIRAAS